MNSRRIHHAGYVGRAGELKEHRPVTHGSISNSLNLDAIFDLLGR
jgi:hypothetical protein